MNTRKKKSTKTHRSDLYEDFSSLRSKRIESQNFVSSFLPDVHILSDLLQNLHRFKVGFTPRDPFLLELMRKVSKQLNLKQVVDFGSEKEMVAAINGGMSSDPYSV